MDEYHKTLPADGTSLWAGMANYILATTDRRHEIDLRYVGEPPHGDSFHELSVDGRRLPGFAWGCYFGVSPCSRHLAASWMAKLYERKTVVIDMEERRFAVLPIYISSFTFHWPCLEGVGLAIGQRYEFVGSEEWTPF